MNETEELLHFGTWTLDIGNNKASWSNGLKTILGYTENDPPTNISHAGFVEHVIKRDAVAFKTAIEYAITNKKGFKQVFTIVTKDKRKK